MASGLRGVVCLALSNGKRHKMAGNRSLDSGRMMSASSVKPARTGMATFRSCTTWCWRFEVSHFFENMLRSCRQFAIVNFAPTLAECGKVTAQAYVASAGVGNGPFESYPFID